MFSKSLMTLAGSAAILITGPALAAPGGGNGGGARGSGAPGANAGASAMGAMQANSNASFNRPTMSGTTTINSNGSAALQNSQGLAHASPNGIAHASPNSVLARGSVSGSTLTGLTTNMTVNNSSGTQIGTVSRIITGPNNTIRAVIVTSSSGQTFTVAPTTLSISGGVVTTTSTSIRG